MNQDYETIRAEITTKLMAIWTQTSDWDIKLLAAQTLDLQENLHNITFIELGGKK